MRKQLRNANGKFGTTPVFMASICTILGAILFLRFGYAVGHVGFIGALGIIFLGHAVTIPTAMAVAEIATNKKVEGGGDYYIISRSFGLNIGAAIGIALFLSQAISIAFYIIAFSEAFAPFGEYLNQTYNLGSSGHFLESKKVIGLSAMGLLTALMLTKGANIGVKALYGVAAVLFFSLAMFFAGESQISLSDVSFVSNIENADNFFYVFTIIFPAFTGISAGLGLSGDLKDPKKSIPRGTLIATIAGVFIYIMVALKLVTSNSLENLANNQMVMSDIAIWGPIIPIGLACAAISSALGSIMVAPRTLQALGKDQIFPSKNFDDWIAKGREKDNEPINGSVITCIIAFFFIYVGDINFVAQIISMFFMVTYGAICLISFLEHFSGDPSYRPTFKSRWYISLLGAVLSVWLMFKMNTPYAILSILLMTVFYYYISKSSGDKREIVNLFRDVLIQFTRQLQIFLQKGEEREHSTHWRPFVVSISSSFERPNAFNITKWISHNYGFGTYIHYIKGYLSRQNFQEGKEVQKKLLIANKASNVYVDTLISPSYTSALAQVVQLSSVSGKKNNLILLEYCEHELESFEDVISNFNLLQATGYDVAILRSNNEKIDNKKEIHIWISSRDYENSNMMILLGYMIHSHPDWKNAEIKVFSIYSTDEEFDIYRERMFNFIESGRLPISLRNLHMVPKKEEESIKSIINRDSKNSDLTIVGFRNELVKKQKLDIFEGYNELGSILFVNSIKEKDIE